MAHQNRKSRKGFLFFCAHFWHFQKSPVLCLAKGDRKKFFLSFGKSASCPWRVVNKKSALFCLAIFRFRWYGEWQENEEISPNSSLFQLVWFCKEWGGNFAGTQQTYLTPDRMKSITARKLGDDFDHTAVREAITQNAQNAARAAETPTSKRNTQAA